MKTKPRRVSTTLLLSVALLGGCSETVSIRSGPSGANVYVDDKPVGTTPAKYDLPRGELGRPHHVRVEKPGYEPATTDLRVRLAKGRVTGAFFTVGILALFRSMHAVDPVFVQLEPLRSGQADQDRVLGESLRNLRELHQSGRISDDELRRRQEELLRGR